MPIARNGWDITQGSGAKYQRKTGDRFENGAGSLPEGLALENFYECATNNGSNMPDWSIKQKVEGLPDGKYRVGAWILTNKLPTEDAPTPKGLFLYAQSLAGEKKVEATDPAETANEGRGYGTWHHYTVDVDVIGGIIDDRICRTGSQFHLVGRGQLHVGIYGQEWKQ